MLYYEELEESEAEPGELPEAVVEQPGPCVTCGKPEQQHGCFKCGKPVCMNETNYLADSDCGGWILDSWHPSAPDENEFWCTACLKESEQST
jgi:hypothetical protein